MSVSVFQKSGVHYKMFGRLTSGDNEFCLACGCTFSAHGFATWECPDYTDLGPIMFYEILPMDNFGLYENLWYNHHVNKGVNKLRRMCDI